MSWTFTAEPEPYSEAVLPLLSKDPAGNTVGLTVLDAISRGQRWGADPMTLGWFTEPDGTVTGAVSMTPPFGLLLNQVPEPALAPLVDALRSGDVAVPSVNGVGPLARRFAELWGGRSEVQMANRLFELGTLAWPDPMPAGSARLVTVADLDLAEAWILAFKDEAEPDAPATPRAMLADRIERELFWFWLDAEGTPVSLAGRNTATAGVSRVGPVYTPRSERGHGYAAAATAVCSRHALDTDSDKVILFTDVENPTSNGIYQRLGYRPLHDRLVLKLS